MIKPGKTIGIVGNGQLGRMSCIEAKKMGYTVMIYGPGKNSPGGQVADVEIDGDYTDLNSLTDFAKRCDVITFEFENIPSLSLEKIKEITPIHPDPSVIQIAQNRISEKNWFLSNGFPTTPFFEITSYGDLINAMNKWNSKAVLKTSMFGYDGKGQVKISSAEESESAWQSLKTNSAILEKWVEFTHELSVIVARNESGEIKTYPVFENSHRNHILDVTVFPGRFSGSVAKQARDIAEELAEKIGLIGLLTIEMFLTNSGELLINELAPRPHNSGHVTFDVCMTSQFQQHIRAVCNFPLGNTDPLQKGIMINILGDSWIDGEPDWKKLLEIEGLNLHLYGKSDPKPARKMGHITITGGDLFEKGNLARQILKISETIH